MKTRIALLAAALILSGCLSPSGSSAKTNYYRLTSVDISDVTDNIQPLDASVLVKVKVPEMLDTPRMAYVQGDYQIAYRETSRWASSLENEISDVVADGLKPYFAHVKTIPIYLGERPDYRLELDIEEAWGTDEGNVVFGLSWRYFDAKKKLLAQGEERVTQDAWKSGDFRNLAQKMSMAASTVAKNIAEKIYSLDAAQK